MLMQATKGSAGSFHRRGNTPDYGIWSLGALAPYSMNTALASTAMKDLSGNHSVPGFPGRPPSRNG